MFTSLPCILIGLVIGLIVAIFQAATQVNEQTLTFMPKLFGILLALIIFGGFMMNNLQDFIFRMFERAATVFV